MTTLLLTVCVEGWGRDGDQCVECPLGTFSNSESSTEPCQPCPEGYTTNVTGNTECSMYKGIIKCQQIGIQG